MASIHEVNFRLKVTRVNRDSIDRLVELADADRNRGHRRLMESFDGDPEDFDVDTFHSVFLHAPKIAFSLYALAIVHCYSIVENNRKLICSRVEGLTDRQMRNLHDIRVVTQSLKIGGISHENIRCYKTMTEFRRVNNAVKHDRYNLSTSIIVDTGRKYYSTQLGSLYKNRARHLESYLSDLYRRVVGQQ